jgi:hypothetical protein
MIKFLNYTIMKKLYFYLLLLPFWGLGASSAWAQNVQLVGSNFDTGAITFTVDVGAATPTWVLVEYTTDPSPDLATMSRATFTDESITPPSAGTLAAENRGFLLTSSATITAKLSGVSDSRFSWCGYAFGAPPNATVNPEGGYTLRGTPPFIVNGSTLTAGETTFGPGTCIESITDFTYNPEGRIPDPPAVTVSASEQYVDPGTEVTFTATASGGATNAMTYTWDIAGTETTSTTNPYSQILSTPCEATYTVRVTNANGCTSTVSNAGSITVFSAGTIATATVYTTAGNPPPSPTVHPTSLAAACAANIEYQWRRSGESAATLSDTPNYVLSSDDYAAAGTYYFNRYAKNKAGDWVPAEGTYTLWVNGAIAPPQYARSKQLWPIVTSSGTLIWSDNINHPSCMGSSCPDHTGCCHNGYSSLYAGSEVQLRIGSMCPSPWRQANQTDWRNTVKALLDVDCEQDNYTDAAYIPRILSFIPVFSGQHHYEVCNRCGYGTIAYYYLTNNGTENGKYGGMSIFGDVICYSSGGAGRHMAVRCVTP